MNFRRVVIKVGTSSLTYPNGRLQLSQIERLVREISDLANAGYEIILVTSGAVGAGMSRLGLIQRPTTIPEKQAVAAVGQGLLMQIYSKIFAEYSQICAQVLLTAEDLQQRKRYLNCRNTLETLLEKHVIPIVNENDSVATDQIKVGDNDTLSALVATLVSADLLIILSDVDGVFAKDPHADPEAPLIPVIEHVDKYLEVACGSAGSLGTGGMVTKFEAARMATRCGIPLVIAHGSKERVITKALRGESVGTLFQPWPVRLPSRKRWIAFYTHPHGVIEIDDGAVQALHGGRSLLPIGVRAVKGRFSQGDLVKIMDSRGTEVAKGLTQYSSEEIDKIKGKSSGEIEELQTCFPYIEVVHRDNLVMTK